jgi:hypothetical protein
MTNEEHNFVTVLQNKSTPNKDLHLFLVHLYLSLFFKINQQLTGLVSVSCAFTFSSLP